MKWEVVRLRRSIQDHEFATMEFFAEDGVHSEQVWFARTIHDLGEDGWELVSVSWGGYDTIREQEIMYFQRPRQ